MKNFIDTARNIHKVLVNFSFYVLYNQLSWMYDAVACFVSRGLWKRWLHEVLAYIDHKDTLEIGHGPGHLMCFLLQNNIDVTGLDLSRSMGRMANKNIHRFLARRKRSIQKVDVPPPALIRACGESIPLSNESYTNIVATFPAPYLFRDQTLLELRRVLSENGKLIILLNAMLDNEGILNRSIIFLIRLFGFAGSLMFDPEQYRILLQKAGFHDVQLVIHHIECSHIYILTGVK